jgi:hypothetical protein
MSYTFKQRFLMFLCKWLGHKAGATWEFKGINSACQRCNTLYKIKEQV